MGLKRLEHKLIHTSFHEHIQVDRHASHAHHDQTMNPFFPNSPASKFRKRKEQYSAKRELVFILLQKVRMVLFLLSANPPHIGHSLKAIFTLTFEADINSLGLVQDRHSWKNTKTDFCPKMKD